MAKAYLVVEHIVTNAEKFEEYRIKVGPMIAKHGGPIPDQGWQPQISRRRSLEAGACSRN